MLTSYLYSKYSILKEDLVCSSDILKKTFGFSSKLPLYGLDHHILRNRNEIIAQNLMKLKKFS